MQSNVFKPSLISLAVALLILVAITVIALWRANSSDENINNSAVATPVLSVNVISPEYRSLPRRVSANGNITAWQETLVGAEVDGRRLKEVYVNVGDSVKHGQVLATFVADTLEADLAQRRGAVAEANAAYDEAEANARRALSLRDTGALSVQQIQQYAHAERIAKARLDVARAAEQSARLQLEQTKVVAPDDGVISARTATLGAVIPSGQELFRLIRQGRLEWRAEVSATDLALLKPGQVANLMPTGGGPVAGKLRILGPVIDTQTRNGIAYVDLPPTAELRAGMYARGEFEISGGQALTLPQSAVLLRDGFSYVMRVGKDFKITQIKVLTGRRVAGQIEILGGIDTAAKVVASGGDFLGDGDLVRVVGDHLGNSTASDNVKSVADGGHYEH